MKQANHVSRRSVLAGLAAVPAAAVAAPAVITDDNAELHSLGERFEPLYAAWAAHMAKWHADQFEFELAVEAETGIRYADISDMTGTRETLGEDAKKAYHAARCKMSNMGLLWCHPVGDEFTTLVDIMNEIAIDILAVAATTREGIALQIKAAIFQHIDGIAPTLEWAGEAEDEDLRCFLASLSAFAGVTLPPYRTFVEMLLDREGGAS
jgi:hypothetical protein